MFNLRGKRAIVTGASGGIGGAIARRLAADGAAVAAHYSGNEAAAKTVVDGILERGGDAFSVGADLREPDAARRLLEGAREGFGGAGLDIIVNNAARFGGTFDEITPDELDVLYAVNVRSPFSLIYAALPELNDGARIVNVSSGATRIMLPEIGYAMTKGALDVMTRNFAKHLGPRGITVNAVAPGITDTGLNPRIQAGERSVVESVNAMTALGRVGEPDDLADAVAFFASDDARWVTGQVVDVSGGLFLGP